MREAIQISNSDQFRADSLAEGNLKLVDKDMGNSSTSSSAEKKRAAQENLVLSLSAARYVAYRFFA